MTDGGVNTGAEGTGEASDWRQGDKFKLDAVVITTADAQAATLPTPGGVALVSQSCDIVLPHRPNVQVAPIVELSDIEARAAREGKRSQYAHLPRLGGSSFADLAGVSTVEKSALIGKRVAQCVAGDDETRRFAAAIARRFGRFAFPDDVSNAMKALRDMVQSKAMRVESPFGRVLGDVLELRAESRAWAEAGSQVTVVFVLVPGALPSLPNDDPGPRPASLDKFEPAGSTAKSRLSEIAEALTHPGAALGAHEKFWLWSMLADAAALLCETKGKSESTSIYPSFDGAVISADEFPLTRVRRSEIIDLDHLSVPFPLDAS